MKVIADENAATIPFDPSATPLERASAASTVRMLAARNAERLAR